jgi:isocitrate/isopropylmalate dehydrogenase
MIRVAILPGDGVGAEVMRGPLELLRRLSEDGIIEASGPWPAGSSAKPVHHSALPPETIEACDAANAILLGAAGLHPGVPSELRPEENPLLVIRDRYDLRVNVRVIGLPGSSNLTIIRNVRGGYFGAASTRREFDKACGEASDLLILHESLVTELAKLACEYSLARDVQLVSADKANLWATSRLWRSVVSSVAEAYECDVRHAYIDAISFEVASDKLRDGVVLTEGIFGDILTDVAAGRAGSISLASSASVNPTGPVLGRCVGLFEPVHGTAPRHTGHGTANPTGMYLALAQLFEWFGETAHIGELVRRAVRVAYESGPRTLDMRITDNLVIDTQSFSRRINEAFLESVTA